MVSLTVTKRNQTKVSHVLTEIIKPSVNGTLGLLESIKAYG